MKPEFIHTEDYVSPIDGHVYKAGINGRINFSKISGSLKLPNLVEIQTSSYQWFKETGLDEVLAEVFPIESFDGSVSINYDGCSFEEPKYTPLQCKAADLTYSSKLKTKLRLEFKSGDMKVCDVYMGDIPLMTDSGTFIVNGAERVIVSQIVRSPGSYFQDTTDKTGLHVYNGEIIPSRGTWLQFETDSKNVMYVRIDRQRKMPATVLFKALGFDSQTDLKTLFGDSEYMRNTLAKDSDIKTWKEALSDIFRKLKPGEPITDKSIVEFIVQKFFDDKRYDLGRAGRFKYGQKLGIYNRLVGVKLAETIETEDGQIFMENQVLTKEDVQALKDAEYFEKGGNTVHLNCRPELDDHSNVNIVKVKVPAKDKDGKNIEKVVNIIGTDLNLSIRRVTVSDMVACFSYFLNVMDGIGQTDDIDHLGNRRIRCVGELMQNQFRIGLSKMAKTVQQKMSTQQDLETMNPKQLINIRPLSSAIREFFASSQLSQFMDQVNPLAELTNKRRISALGPGGLTRDRASMEVRDVHYTHYGRICPIETPEGQNIGLINNLSTYARIDNYGFIETPYRVVIEKNGHYYVSDRAEYLSADAERGHFIAEANLPLGEPVEVDGEMVKEIIGDEIVCRHDEDNVLAHPAQIDYVDVSPKQIVSIAAACIPFLENDDSTRALMGANMQRQALPLLRPEIPYVGTGMEAKIATDAGLAVVAVADGLVVYVDSQTIKVTEEGGVVRQYDLQKFNRSNNDTCINQCPIVAVGDQIKKGQVIADGPAMNHGELALGRNVLIAYMTWEGYNYEDAIIMSERMVKEDFYTTVHIEKYEVECRVTKLGKEEITRDIPNVSEEAKAFLDENGIVVKGAEVKEGDILVGKVTPKGQTEPTPEEKLLMAIFNEKAKEGKDTSLRVPHGGAGIVLDVKVFNREDDKQLLPPDVEKCIRIYVVQKRKISEGDKMSGRHGNKGVISRILPIQDMPFLADGTPIDIMLSPMGVPSRMNIGQIFEVHLGLACRKLGMRIATPVFDGISDKEVFALMKKAGIAEDGKTVLYDGRTGERFSERISVGIQYMIKLVHMVDDKLHARATGPYSLVTQQPLGGKAQRGGQRFGEMEVWALEAYGAAHVLQEMITIKSDDRVGRRKAYEAIIKGDDIPRSSMPEAFKVFTKELRGLGVKVILKDKEGSNVDLDEIAKNNIIEERKANSAIRNLASGKDSQEQPETIEVEREQAMEEGLNSFTKAMSLD
ncbi:MAG: DNA-directed RNA polymerase subunit beta [Bacilli bacterium]|nr:DNA-directed RNA polymerase subunit beta [Bacilli bacterium]